MVLLNRRIAELARPGSDDTMAIVLPTKEGHEACIALATDPLRNVHHVDRTELESHVFDIDGYVLFAILYPKSARNSVFPFWNNMGMIISSRLAEHLLNNFDTIKQLPSDSVTKPLAETPAYKTIRQRIVDFMQRAPRTADERHTLHSSDVYLYQSGMSAIYNVHRCLNLDQEGTNVLFGFAFESTPLLLKWFSKNSRIFGRGTELDELEDWAQDESDQGRPLRCIWLEFPANPLLTTPDLVRLRQIATKNSALLVVDETIGSFANVDLFGPDGVDISVCSLSKSFNGYADLLAGAAILNPSAPNYTKLKKSLDANFQNLLYSADAEVLEYNSRNYLERVKIINRNAEAIVDLLRSLQAIDPNGPILRIHYPSNPEYRSNFDVFKRASTADFTPCYGGLMNIELKTNDTAGAFHDSLCDTMHVGPHLGAHLTCALAYTWTAYGKDLDRVVQYGLNRRQIRVSAGLEDKDALLRIFEVAYETAKSAM